MNQIIKTYLTIFLMLIMILVGTGLIVCSIDARRAEKLNSGYALAIAGHNYSESVIQACIEEASSNDYLLNVNKWDTNNDGHYDICECVLEYDYTLIFLNPSNESTNERTHHYSRIIN